MKKVLLFDYDGTILDSLDVVWRGFVYAAKKEGIKEVSKVEFSLFYLNNVYDSFLKAGVKKERLTIFVDEMGEIYKKEEKTMKLFPNMKKIIKELAEKSDIYVISSNMTSSIEGSIKTHKLEGIKEVLGGDKGLSKVDKINKIKEKYPESEIYYIGDTKGDMIEAEKAGIRSVAVTWGYHKKELLETAEPDYVLEKTVALLDVFG